MERGGVSDKMVDETLGPRSLFYLRTDRNKHGIWKSVEGSALRGDVCSLSRQSGPGV